MDSERRAIQLARHREDSKAKFQEAVLKLAAKSAGGLEIASKFSASGATSASLSSAGDNGKAEKNNDDMKGTMEGEKKKKKKKRALNTLSFVNNDEEDDNAESNSLTVALIEKKKKIKKNPSVETSFLPDRERELVLEEEKQKLRLQWQEEQKKVQEEMLEVVYSYWDGTGHRRSIKLRKGSTIGEFLDMVRQQLSKEFKEARNSSSDEYMYVKEDLIIPHSYSFYDLIVRKARGKSGPLFQFDVHEDIRLMGDATVEKDESHPGKVVSRRWYDRNKHIFPASRWEVFDISDQRQEKYTIKGK